MFAYKPINELFFVKLAIDLNVPFLASGSNPKSTHQSEELLNFVRLGSRWQTS